MGGGEACGRFRGFDQRLAPRYSEEAGASSFPGWPRNSPWLRRKRGARRLTPAVVLDGWNRARRSVGPIPDHRSEVRTADSDRQSAARESPARDRAQRQPGVCRCAGVEKPVSMRENLSVHLSKRRRLPRPARAEEEVNRRSDNRHCSHSRSRSAAIFTSDDVGSDSRLTIKALGKSRARTSVLWARARPDSIIRSRIQGRRPKRRERTFRCDESPWSRETIREFVPDRSADKPQLGSATLPILRSVYSFRGSGFRLPGR